MKWTSRICCLAVGVSALLPAGPAFAQGRLRTITFDGPPSIQPSDSIAVTGYSEQEMRFKPLSPSTHFGRSGGAEVNEGFPRNGGPYIYAMYGESVAVDSLSGLPFGLVSVDLGEFSTLYATPRTVPFVGYKADGSTVTIQFVTDGIIDRAGPINDFETFYFDARFVGLVRVEVPTYRWSMDNLVVSDAVPEPSAGALLAASGVLLAGFGFWKRKQRVAES